MRRVAGAGLLITTGAIHLDLYLTGYRTIPTIGWLFLLLATLGGYLLSVWTGLFGFREVRTTASILAGVIEVAAFTVLAAQGPEYLACLGERSKRVRARQPGTGTDHRN